MAMTDMVFPADARLEWFDGQVNAAILDSGVVGFGPLLSKRNMVDDLILADVDPLNFTGFGISARFKVPPHLATYDRVHFHVVVSTEPVLNYSGLDTPGMVMEKYSEDFGGFYLEAEEVYQYPSAGANIETGSPQINLPVVFTAFNLTCPPFPLYVFWRARYYDSDEFVAEGDFSGIPYLAYSSPSFNTGDPVVESPQAIRICDRSTWLAGARAEVYIGSSPSPSYYLSGGGFVAYFDGAVSPSGFRYFDGSSMSVVPFTGFPAYSGQTVYLLTNSIPTDSPLFICSRMKWTGGSSAWTSTLFFPATSHDDPVISYSPSNSFYVPAAQPTDYHIQVIYGTDPDLNNYFASPGDFEPDLSFPGLFHYAYSYDLAQSVEFSYFESGEIVHPAEIGFPNSAGLNVVHVCPVQYGGLDLLYKFWRVVTAGPWIP
jgi:hypothetical protein